MLIKKHIKLLTLNVVCLLHLSLSYSQVDPQLTQFMLTRLVHNPGYAGVNGAMCGQLLTRQQWVNFPGAPKTYLLNFDMAVPELPIGVGSNIVMEQLGFTRNLFLKLAAAYQHTLPNGHTISGGIDLGIMQSETNGTWIPGSPAPDPKIPSGVVTMTPFDMGVGLFYLASTFYVGLSSTHITAPNSTVINIPRHYYLMGGYYYSIDKFNVINSNINIKSAGTALQFDINCMYSYDATYSAGLSYRMNDAVSVLLGYKFTQGIKITYSYDITTSELRQSSVGSHEFSVSYCYKLKKKRKTTSHQNPLLLN